MVGQHRSADRSAIPWSWACARPRSGPCAPAFRSTIGLPRRAAIGSARLLRRPGQASLRVCAGRPRLRGGVRQRSVPCQLFAVEPGTCRCARAPAKRRDGPPARGGMSPASAAEQPCRWRLPSRRGAASANRCRCDGSGAQRRTYRRADRTAQSARAANPSSKQVLSSPGSGSRFRPAADRPRPVQDRQRHPGPPDRRQASLPCRGPPAQDRASRRSSGAPRRR